MEGPYSRGDKFPEWMVLLTDKNLSIRDTAKENIALNFEHQETLWLVTPFVMLQLQKILKNIVRYLFFDNIYIV
ncbi:hypothetical protein [Methanobrevibacter filiformis]|uniref:hypothetical protein n=1 Tax=Methanobrevibacter filiformis TaxID=55758 RepID=UPI0012ED8B51|nr:hypothetical protein [Methanobrevibacter filiformis]